MKRKRTPLGAAAYKRGDPEDDSDGQSKADEVSVWGDSGNWMLDNNPSSDFAAWPKKNPSVEKMMTYLRSCALPVENEGVRRVQ